MQNVESDSQASEIDNFLKNWLYLISLEKLSKQSTYSADQNTEWWHLFVSREPYKTQCSRI